MFLFMLSLYGFKIKSSPSVYEPAEDTFLLISALENFDLTGKTALEIGTGSGIIALVLAKKGACVTAVDINPEAVECAKKNVKLNVVAGVIPSADGKLLGTLYPKIDVIQSDLFANVRKKFDLIVFNTPYLPNEPGSKDVALDGGKDGRRVIERFIAAAPKFLKNNGTLLLLESSLSHYEKTIEYFGKTGMRAEIIARQKFDWEELVVIRAAYPKA